MATVHCAYDLLLGRQVAVKILASNVAASPAHLERFGREARAMAAMSLTLGLSFTIRVFL